MGELPDDIKPILIELIEEEVKILNQKQQKSAMLYFKAQSTLRRHPDPIRKPTDLLPLRGFGPKIVEKLTLKLNTYCRNNGFAPVSVPSPEQSKRGRADPTTVGGDPKKRKTNRNYIPKKRSGAYAILLALLEHDPRCRGLTKSETSTYGSKYCDVSFTVNSSTGNFYSAWGGVNQLKKYDLVKQFGTPARFSLTDEGKTLALSLKEADNIEFDTDIVQEENGHGDVTADISTNLSQLVGDDISSNDFLSRATSLLKELNSGDEEESMQTNPANKESLKAYRYSNVSYGVWEAGTYEIMLVLDNREVRSQGDREFFQNRLSELGVSALVRQLQVGDGLWIAKHIKTGVECVLNFILERKRLDDLAASIKDARYLEQKSRLKLTGTKNIYYVIEEAFSSDLSTMADALTTSISLAMVHDGFRIKKTKDADDTALWLSRMHHVVRRQYQNKKLIVISPRNLDTQASYRDILTSFRDHFERNAGFECVHTYYTFDTMLSKSDLTTVQEMFIRMLMTCNGISLEKAISIQKHFPTPSCLIEAYKACKNEGEKVALVHNATRTEFGNRVVGAKGSEAIYRAWGRM